MFHIRDGRGLGRRKTRLRAFYMTSGSQLGDGGQFHTVASRQMVLWWKTQIFLAPVALLAGSPVWPDGQQEPPGLLSFLCSFVRAPHSLRSFMEQSKRCRDWVRGPGLGTSCIPVSLCCVVPIHSLPPLRKPQKRCGSGLCSSSGDMSGLSQRLFFWRDHWCELSVI